MMRRRVLISLIPLIACACSSEEARPVERVRAVKTMVVAEQASAESRKFPGAVDPVNDSVLSFEVNGLVREVNVSAGDVVREGQVLAVIDKQPFELNVESARAALARARAQFTEKEAAFERERRIQTQDAGATTQNAVDQAQAAFASSRESVSYHRAQLELAQRDLKNTELRAPFDGVIYERHVDAFEEVNRGQPIFSLFVDGAMEVSFALPEHLLAKVFTGMSGQVRLPNRDKRYQAVISEVGSAASATNAFTVKARITDTDDYVRPGMTAELTLAFALTDTRRGGYLIPVQALSPGLSRDDRHVFVYDAETSTVRKRVIQGAGLIGDQIVVIDGIAPGDTVVVAGVPFLRDGQPVTLMTPADGG